MSRPEEIINRIRREEFQLEADGTPKTGTGKLLDRIHRMGQQLSDGLYDESVHFIFELIQNAEDNDYAHGLLPALKFQLLKMDPTGTPNAEGCLCILNNEIGFQRDNVEAICDFNNSTKKGQKASGFIGEKGIGFKSVFKVSDSPHVYSNGFRFKFLKDDPVATVGYIVPYWLNDVPEAVTDSKEFQTSILLPLRPGEYEKVEQELREFQSETTLFLKRIRRIEISLPDQDILIERQDDGPIVTMSYLSESESVSQRFWLQTQSFEVPPEVVEEKRIDVRERDVTVAFPLEGGTGKEKIFAYLPTKEHPGLPYYINSDFLLGASRETVIKDSDWNHWLFAKTTEVVAEGIIAMLKTTEIGSKAYRFVPLKTDISSGQEAFHPLVKSIQDNLAAVPCIRGEDGKLYLSANSRLMPPKYRSALGDDLPSYFDDLNLAERAANEFKARLKPLGLESVLQSELEEIFGDKEWVQKKDIEWCAKALIFLRTEAEINRVKPKKVIFGGPKPYKMSLDKFAVVPALNGKKYVGAQLFMPLSNDHHQRLSQIPNDLRDELLTIDPAISQALTKLEADPDILTDDFEVQDFSVSNFISKTMLKTLNDEELEVSVNHLKRSIKFCMSCWDELEEHGETDILESLPLLLENDEIVALYGVGDREIVTPRTWDEKTGWQLVFDDFGHKERYAVLADFYQSIRSKSVEDYFDSIEASEFPQPKIEFYTRHTIGKAQEKFKHNANQVFFNNNSKYKTTWENRDKKTVGTPTLFGFSGFVKNELRRNAFIHWINNYRNQVGKENLFSAHFNWYYYEDQNELCESEFLFSLRWTPWVKTSQGYKRPEEVFAPSETLKQIFKNKVPFLEDSLDPQIIEALDIKSEATEKELIEYLIALAEGETNSPPIEIYRYLDDHAEEDLGDFFRENPLIFTARNGDKWMKSVDVFWEDGSLALGDQMGWLEPTYPQSLKEFFVEKLGVRAFVDIEAYADAWLSVQSESVDAIKIEPVLGKAIRELRHGHQKLSVKDTGNDFRKSCQLWSLDGTWQSPDDIYVNDARDLYELFKDNYYFVWTPDSLTHQQLEMFFDWLGVEYISAAASYQLAPNHCGQIRETNHYLNEHSLELIFLCVAALDKAGNGDLERIFESGVGRSLYGITEYDVENLEIEVHIGDQSHTLPESTAFIDWESARLYVDLNSEADDVKDDVAKHISRKIRGAKYKVLLPFITDILSVSTEARRRKVREKYSWSFSRDQRKTFNAFKKDLHTSSITEVADAPVNFNDNPEKYEAASVDPSDQNAPQTPPADPLPDQPEISEGPDGASDSKPIGLSNGSKSNDISNTSSPIPGRSGQEPPSPRYPSALSIKNGSRVGKSRSAGRARTLNFAKRNRMLSYVSHEDRQERDSGADEELASVRKKLGDRGEQIVVDDLRAKGYLAELMQANNPGFDIEAIHPETGELLYFEVKSLADLWDGQGVTISQTQYDCARVNGESYFLAVVEGLNKPPPYSPEYIQDPISKINNYAFDVNWRKISTHITTIIPPVGAGSSVDVLIAETDSENGVKIIEFCQQNGLDLPEIGGDICDVSGRVILDNIEMVWEDYAICVFIAGTLDNTDVGKADKWTFLPDDNIERIKLRLRGFLSTNDEDVSP